MSKLRVTLACRPYDRTNALHDGRVNVEGVDLNFLPQSVEEVFFRMVRSKEFEVAEMSLSSYIMTLFQEEPPFIAIPVFPARAFRHSCIFINRDSGIKQPADLIGKRIGVPEYEMTALVWIRGILSDYYNVPFDSVRYFAGGQEQPDRPEKLNLDLPSNIELQRIGPGKTLARMLADGEIDALYSARVPSSYDDSNSAVIRLFQDFQQVEIEYYRQTKCFPIMHTVVIRRDIYDSNRWLAMSLQKAFVEAQRSAYDELHETGSVSVMMPWLVANLMQVEKEMGLDFWPYGLEKNHDVLAQFLRYSYEQGLSPQKLSPGALFAPETLETFKI